MKHVPETGEPPSSDKAVSSVYLLDTSALLSFIEDEEGAGIFWGHNIYVRPGKVA